MLYKVVSDTVIKASTMDDAKLCEKSSVEKIQPEKPYIIGENGPAGGVVFSVTDDGLQGLEAAPVDQGVAQWGDFETLITVGKNNPDADFGVSNTVDIIANSDEINTAAEMAKRYRLNGYDDWFLPSKQALNLLYIHKDIVGGFANGVYWSSTELSGNYAFSQCFDKGYQNYDSKNTELFVRAIRLF